MPIDPDFQKKRTKIGKEKGVAIWGPLDPPKKLGIRGSNIAVDWDICTGCGLCLKNCPAQVYEWHETEAHPTSQKKPLPSNVTKCLYCYQCEKQCPVQAIRVIFGGPQSPLEILASYLIVAQLIGGPLYGLLLGPYLRLTIPFYLGWVIFALSPPFFFSPVLYFKRSGKPAEGKGVMDTTAVVESGTYGIVRHPQYLGSILSVCASLLITQHWLFALITIFIVGITSKMLLEEEQSLILKFGDDYKRYMKKVPGLNFILGTIRLLQRRKKIS